MTKHDEKDVVYYSTDFGRVFFPPGMTVAMVKANEKAIKEFARSRWSRGIDDPYDWPPP